MQQLQRYAQSACRRRRLHHCPPCEPQCTIVTLLIHQPSPVCRQQLPEDYAGFPSQLFAVLTAVFGLASFALVLTFVEQVIVVGAAGGWLAQQWSTLPRPDAIMLRCSSTMPAVCSPACSWCWRCLKATSSAAGGQAPIAAEVCTRP